MKTERLAGRDVFRATESSDEDGVQWITILKEGTSENNRRYGKSTLKRAVDDRVYENMRMFVDHSDGPPLKRSMKDLVSAITTTKYDESFPDGKARIRGAVEWIDEEWQKKIEKGKDFVGVSHDALLKGTRSMKNGRRFEDINEIPRVNSVDWVIYASAGGGFENSFIAKEGVEVEDAIDWDAIDEEMLKEKSPELYKKLTARGKEAVKAPTKKNDEDDEEEEEDDSEEGQESIEIPKNIEKSLARSIESMVTRAVESVQEKQTKKATAHGQIADYVNKSSLPQVTKQRVVASFDGAEAFDEERVKEAVEEAKKEVAAIAGPRIRGMGPSGDPSKKRASFGRAHEAVEAVFGMSKTAKNGKEEKEEE